MSSLTGLVLLLLFIFAAHGLAPLPPPPAINVPSSSTSSILGLLNLSSTANDVQIVNATNDLIKCDGKRLGYNLNRTSCEEAWKKMPTDSGLHTYGARIKGFFERPTPYRYLSDDGLCAIDINHMKRVIHDAASNNAISAAAKSILDKCIFRDTTKKPSQGTVPIGGDLAYVGIHSGLSVKVSSYSPDVKCTFDSGHEDETACAKLMGTFLVGVTTFVFTRDKQTGEKSVIIPPGGRKITNALGTCTAIIDFVEGDTDISSWIEMWAAAEAVNEMCVTKGGAGAAFGLGQNKRLMLSLIP